MNEANGIAASAAQDISRPEIFRRLRRLVHRRLIDSIETDGAEILADDSEVIGRVGQLIDVIEEDSEVVVEPSQRRQIESEILQELGGMGPLAALMIDTSVSDILVNGPDEVWVDRFGQLERTDVSFDDEAHLRRFLDRIVATQGRNLDLRTPMVDARLSDGSRVHAVGPASRCNVPVSTAHGSARSGIQLIDSHFAMREQWNDSCLCACACYAQVLTAMRLR